MKLRHLGKLMLVSVLAAALVTGCGGSGSTSEPKESAEETAAEETVTEETPEEEKEPVFVEAEVKEETAEAAEEPAFEPKETIDWNTDEKGEVKTMDESEWPEWPDNF